MKILKWAAISLGILIVGIQFVRPAKTNPPIDEASTIGARLQVTPEVAAIFDRSCSDCHSHRTTWPWYSNVAPISWLVIDDVNQGRKHFNLSDWPTDPKRSARRLEEISEQVEQGDMPLPMYVYMHSKAKLSEADRKALSDWANNERQRIAASGQTEPAKAGASGDAPKRAD
jgi:heme-binding protein